jgi:hypothetical protein
MSKGWPVSRLEVLMAAALLYSTGPVAASKAGVLTKLLSLCKM